MYTRHGEPSLDTAYKPVHLSAWVGPFVPWVLMRTAVAVEYYRYLRLFPDGGAVFVTTPEPPEKVFSIEELGLSTT